MNGLAEHTHEFYGPRRALDGIRPILGIATAAATVCELESITRGVWSRGTVVDVDDKDAEVISAIVMTNDIELYKCTAVLDAPSLPPPVELPSTGDLLMSPIHDQEDPEPGEVTEAPAQVAGKPAEVEGKPAEVAEVEGKPAEVAEVEGQYCSFGDEELPPAGRTMGCPSVTAWRNRNYLWAKFDEGILMDSTAWYEVIPEAVARAIGQTLNRILTKDDRLFALSRGTAVPEKPTPLAHSVATADDAADETADEAAEGDAAGLEVEGDGSGGEGDEKKGEGGEKEEGETCDTEDACFSTEDVEACLQAQPVTSAGEQECSSAGDERDERPILCGCCGVGGDCIAIAAEVGARVVGVDILPEKIEMAKHNASLYGVREKIEFVCADVNEYAKLLSSQTVRKQICRVTKSLVNGKDEISVPTTHEVLVRPYRWAVMSPPWGGPKYSGLYSFFLSDQKFTDLTHLMQSAMSLADNLVLLLPRNQDLGEIIHLLAHGAPDGHRFNYLHVRRLMARRDASPLMVALYCTRDECILPYLHSEESLSALYRGRMRGLRAFSSLNGDVLGRIMKEIGARKRKPAPCFNVQLSILLKNFERQRRLGYEECSLMQPLLTQFFLQWLQEPVSNIASAQFCADIIGVSQCLNLIAETIRIIRKGGLMREDKEPRTRGGVFFNVIKTWYPDALKALRKWRKLARPAPGQPKPPNKRARTSTEQQTVG